MLDKLFVIGQIVGVALLVAAVTVAFEWVGFLVGAGVGLIVLCTAGEFLSIVPADDEDDETGETT